MKTRLCILLMVAIVAVSQYLFGQELVPAQCPQNLADKKYGFKDKNTGEMVIPCVYMQVWNFSEHIAELAKVKINITSNNVNNDRAILKYGFIDKNGKEVIPLKYDDIYPFSECFKDWAMVRVNSKYGFINKLGNEVIPVKFSNSKFNFYEGLAVVIVNERCGFIDKSGKEVISCIYESAENFSNGLAWVRYCGDVGHIDIAGTFYPGKKRAKAEKKVAVKKANGEYESIYAQIKEAERRALEVNIAHNPIDSKSYNNSVSQENQNVAKSDVATYIPVTGAKNEKTFAVIIANENYRSESKVEFAKNDGETFHKYCIKTLGIPEKNVHYTENATLNDIRREINWISQIADAFKEFKEETKIIFYYAGHGIPDESAKASYLLPVDGFGSDVKTGYKLEKLYDELGKLSVHSVFVFLDACFSGAQRSGEILASARGVAIKAEQGVPTGNVIVFSAAQGNETAFPYKEKGHGLFTYFLLKKLQETKGEATLGELENYITTQVKQQSVVVNSKPQTPKVTPSDGLVNWKGLKLR